MAVSVYIPTSLRKFTGNQASIEAQAKDVAGLLMELATRFPGIKERILDEEGNVPYHINVYVNNEEIAALQGKETALRDGDQVALVPAIAGGALAFTEEQIRRYSRHIILSEVGGKGQKKLLGAKVLLIGAGGLGSPAALYLAAAGVG
ncbi:MAG: MoaD/ThiS family protein, partial [Dehalococcoidia bacterium]|nr:MoaD/ThiS family protein [Dehalococcoidia bacterium]